MPFITICNVGIVGHGTERSDRVFLREFYVGIVAECIHHQVAFCRRNAQDPDVELRDGIDLGRSVDAEQLLHRFLRKMRHWPCENFIRDSQVACAGPARREEGENGCESKKCASAGWTEKVKNVHAGWNYGFYSTGCATTAVDPSRSRNYVRCSQPDLLNRRRILEQRLSQWGRSEIYSNDAKRLDPRGILNSLAARMALSWYSCSRAMVWGC